MRAAAVLLATAAALALQTTLAQFVIRGVAVDFVLVVVVYAALVGGPVMGLMAGTFAGIVQDALSGGIIGIGGLAKTVVGFLAGVIGTQFIVAQPLPRFVVFFGATLVHAFIVLGLYRLLGSRPFDGAYGAVAGQGVANALIGVIAFQLAELLPGAVERRRLTKTRLRR